MKVIGALKNTDIQVIRVSCWTVTFLKQRMAEYSVPSHRLHVPVGLACELPKSSIKATYLFISPLIQEAALVLPSSPRCFSLWQMFLFSPPLCTNLQGCALVGATVLPTAQGEGKPAELFPQGWPKSHVQDCGCHRFLPGMDLLIYNAKLLERFLTGLMLISH